MIKRMSTYEKIKEVLDANLATITTLIDANRRISIIKFKELKEDTEEIKQHAKETNGNVARNVERIHILDIDQSADNRFRKRSWFFVASVLILIVADIVTKILI